jgi:hypothetical protein
MNSAITIYRHSLPDGRSYIGQTKGSMLVWSSRFREA